MELLGSDPDTDVALVRIPADNLSAIPIGDSDRLRVKTLEQLREAAENRIYRIKLRRGKRLISLVSR